jgi:hypothetical protein
MNDVMPEVSVNRVSANGKKEEKEESLVIAPLKQAIIQIPIVGESPLKILRFSKKKQETIIATQQAGDQAKSRKKRDPKDFLQDYEEARYKCTQKEGGKKVVWDGLNASGVRCGLIECCRVAGFVMTKAKMSVFCMADGCDDVDATQLVRIFGEPEMTIDHVRNASGVIDLRARAMFREWKMVLRIRFDEGMFGPADVVNLAIRLGQQNGLGEGRPNGTIGAGTGNGLFVVDLDAIKIVYRSEVPKVFVQ